jgi:Txe/YoeB family toxin of Txe-Axe toxin-antitoxin module
MDWGVVYIETRGGKVPAEEFLDACPTKVDARFSAVLEAVRSAPPPQFSGGGFWEAMHGDMGGYYEIRLTGAGRRQYRLFCILDNGTPEELAERGFDQPQIAAITGMVKEPGTRFASRDYLKVRKLGNEYLRQFPRRIAQTDL